MVGVADTTFARVDMASQVIEILRAELPEARIVRYTVPGIKDLPVAAKKLLDMGCDAVITLGWVGAKPVDKYSYLAASLGLIIVQILEGRHVIDVTVHEDEADDPARLVEIAVDRARKHTYNLIALLKRGGEGLRSMAGTGRRQGYPDAGPLKP